MEPLSSVDDPQRFVREVRRTLHNLVAATIVLAIVLTAVAYFAWRSADNNRQAVCNLRIDLEQRISGSEDFVANHPTAILKLGFTPEQIQKEIINQRRTLAALSVVDC